MPTDPNLLDPSTIGSPSWSQELQLDRERSPADKEHLIKQIIEKIPHLPVDIDIHDDVFPRLVDYMASGSSPLPEEGKARCLKHIVDHFPPDSSSENQEWLSEKIEELDTGYNATKLKFFLQIRCKGKDTKQLPFQPRAVTGIPASALPFTMGTGFSSAQEKTGTLPKRNESVENLRAFFGLPLNQVSEDSYTHAMLSMHNLSATHPHRSTAILAFASRLHNPETHVLLTENRYDEIKQLIESIPSDDPLKINANKHLLSLTSRLPLRAMDNTRFDDAVRLIPSLPLDDPHRPTLVYGFASRLSDRRTPVEISGNRCDTINGLISQGDPRYNSAKEFLTDAVSQLPATELSEQRFDYGIQGINTLSPGHPYRSEAISAFTERLSDPIIAHSIATAARCDDVQELIKTIPKTDPYYISANTHLCSAICRLSSERLDNRLLNHAMESLHNLAGVEDLDARGVLAEGLFNQLNDSTVPMEATKRYDYIAYLAQTHEDANLELLDLLKNLPRADINNARYDKGVAALEFATLNGHEETSQGSGVSAFVPYFAELLTAHEAPVQPTEERRMLLVPHIENLEDEQEKGDAEHYLAQVRGRFEDRLREPERLELDRNMERVRQQRRAGRADSPPTKAR